MMKIGDITFGPYPLFLAPMEDVTDPAFRMLCKQQGADMVTTEFVSSDALIRNVRSTEKTEYPEGRTSCCYSDLRKRPRYDGRGS